MADLYIGVNVKDAQTLSLRRPGLDNAPLNTAGFLVYSVRGIDDVMVFSDFDSAKRALGGFDNNYYGMYAIKGFFDNVGSNGILFVKRLIDSSSALPSSATYQTRDTLGTAFEIKAGFRGQVDRGTWGNNLKVNVVDEVIVLSNLAANASSGANQIQVDSIDGYEVNDIVKIDNGTNTEYFYITSIDEQNLLLTLNGNLVNSYSSPGTTISRVRYSIYVYYVDPSNGIPSLVEQFVSLSSNPNHSRYVGDIVNNTETGSSFIVIENIDITGTYDKMPSPNIDSSFANSTSLTGGSNGNPIITGNLPSYYATLDKYPIRFVANVEMFGESAYEKGKEYADSMKDRVFVFNLPDLGMSSVPSFSSFDDIISWIKPKRRSVRYYSMIVKDWVNVDNPLGTALNPYKKVPIVGHLIGYMIDQILKKGVHRVPANTIESIKGIVNISNEVIDRAKLTELVENGINVVSTISNGFYLRSSRTISLSRIERYLNTIMTLIYVKESLKGIMIPYENYPTESLPALAEQVIKDWAKNFYESSSNGGAEGGFGQGSFDEVFKVIVDESVNPKPQLADGIVKALVYFVPPSSPAEKILLEVGLIDLI
ncbi:MAG: hypothetical protein KatS3mg068_1494 [Candidatus Sericytochromatia bacterium]|nr:MAG: hypothetical protein KatS3mg068_1494 [Candidatus Sericytochromatia bacterium]